MGIKTVRLTRDDYQSILVLSHEAGQLHMGYECDERGSVKWAKNITDMVFTEAEPPSDACTD